MNKLQQIVNYDKGYLKIKMLVAKLDMDFAKIRFKYFRIRIWLWKLLEFF